MQSPMNRFTQNTQNTVNMNHSAQQSIDLFGYEDSLPDRQNCTVAAVFRRPYDSQALQATVPLGMQDTMRIEPAGSFNATERSRGSRSQTQARRPGANRVPLTPIAPNSSQDDDDIIIIESVPSTIPESSDHFVIETCPSTIQNGTARSALSAGVFSQPDSMPPPPPPADYCIQYSSVPMETPLSVRSTPSNVIKTPNQTALSAEVFSQPDSLPPPPPPADYCTQYSSVPMESVSVRPTPRNVIETPHQRMVVNPSVFPNEAELLNCVGLALHSTKETPALQARFSY